MDRRRAELPCKFTESYSAVFIPGSSAGDDVTVVLSLISCISYAMFWSLLADSVLLILFKRNSSILGTLNKGTVNSMNICTLDINTNPNNAGFYL